MRKKILNINNLNNIIKKKLLKIELLDNKKKIDYFEEIKEQFMEEEEEDILNDPGFSFNNDILDHEYFERKYPGFIEWGAIDYMVQYNNKDLILEDLKKSLSKKNI